MSLLLSNNPPPPDYSDRSLTLTETVFIPGPLRLLILLFSRTCRESYIPFRHRYTGTSSSICLLHFLIWPSLRHLLYSIFNSPLLNISSPRFCHRWHQRVNNPSPPIPCHPSPFYENDNLKTLYKPAATTSPRQQWFCIESSTLGPCKGTLLLFSLWESGVFEYG